MTGKLTPEQKEALAREAARSKESDEQKWLRSAMREEIAEWAEEFFAAPEGKEGEKKGGVFDLSGLFGKTGS